MFSSKKCRIPPSESIELFIEDQTFLRMFDLAPLLPYLPPPLPSASWLGYGFKNLWKIYSLAYGFSFFVISISGSSSCTRVQVFLPLLVMLLLKSSVQDIHKRNANHVYSITAQCTCFYILQRLEVKSKACCLPAKDDRFFSNMEATLSPSLHNYSPPC
jgi:hypothetical protein